MALALAAAATACMPMDRRGGAPEGERAAADDRRVEDVASGPLDPRALRREEQRPMAPQRRLPRVESVGSCAPLYRSGGGSAACVNSRPCRGFGVRLESGAVACSCYGVMGGCSEGQRCDDRKLTCVPEDEPIFERGRAN